MTDFWHSCGHHFLDRDESGGYVVTDDFLKVYLARPELIPPPDACSAERNLHAALIADPRRCVAASDIMEVVDKDARAITPRPAACGARKGPLDFRHPNLGFNRVGNETILMGGMMHLIELFRTGLSVAAPRNLWA
jgi:hypothetical protein